MFSIVHVLLPFSERSPIEANRASLSRYERGGRGDVPDEWLAFHDESSHVRALHEARFVFSQGTSGGMRIEGGDFDYLDVLAIEQEMLAKGTT